MRPYNYIILVTLSLVSTSYGTQHEGLKIRKLVPQQQTLSQKEKGGRLLKSIADLPNLLKSDSVTLSNAPTFLEQLPPPVKNSTYVDDYDSDESQSDIPDEMFLEAQKALKDQGHRGMVQKKEVYNYSRSQGIPATYFPPDSVDISPKILATETKAIEEADINQGHITIFCVALRDMDGRIKKFAFSNEVLMPRANRNKATALGYAVIKAGKSHAECQFLQFLYQRQSKSPQLYTHLVGMGCSRLHCSECDLLLNQCFGKKYKDITAAISSASVTGSDVQKGSISEGNNNFKIDKEIKYEIALGSGAVKDRQTENYYMPPVLQKLIEHLVNLTLEVAPNSRYAPSSNTRRSEADS